MRESNFLIYGIRGSGKCVFPGIITQRIKQSQSTEQEAFTALGGTCLDQGLWTRYSSVAVRKDNNQRQLKGKGVSVAYG